MTEYRSRRMRAIHGLPPRQLPIIPHDKWTPDQAPGRLFQPWALTVVLDRQDLYDPELSAELGVPVGEVDRWEEGTTIPTIEEAKALARLTGYPLRWFYRPGPPPVLEGAFICPGGAVDLDPVVPIGRGRWKIQRERPDALLPMPLPLGDGR